MLVLDRERKDREDRDIYIMSRDNWEKLVGAVLRRENDRRLAYCESFSSSSSAGLSSRFSFVRDVHESAAEVSIFFSRDVKAMEYTEIRKATGNFGADSMLGGEPLMSRSRVYKGWIDENYAAVKPGSGIAVAVELEMADSIILFDYWHKKIKLSQHRHLNLVTPIGYYFDTNTIIFVNEFMAGGSLAHHLFRAQKPLPWATRIGVALGAARGLAFLHNLEVPITYQVLMSDHILLDADFNAKLSGFGIAEDVSKYDLPMIEGPRGLVTPNEYKYGPYAPPKFVDADGPSTRGDVYNFGVVLLEILSGHRAGLFEPMEWKYLIRDLGDKRLSTIMDSKLEGQYPLKEAYKVANIALKCASSYPRLRPRMADVVAELENM